jgi:hypothetical protein
MVEQVINANDKIGVAPKNYIQCLWVSSDTKSFRNFSNLLKLLNKVNTQGVLRMELNDLFKLLKTLSRSDDWIPLKTHVKISLKSGEILWNL